MSEITFDRRFEPRHGEAVAVAPLVRRVTAPNAGPFTFHGTNTFIVGEGRVAVIDPGPEDERHLAALLEALASETVTHIVVSHTHRDHSPLARALAARTGAPIVGAGPHRPARPLATSEADRLDSTGDTDHMPHRELADGEVIEGDGWTLQAVATPGHTANHLAFAFPEQRLLFSGDHVMAWSTTIVAPPDGSMSDYMASLERLSARDDALYLPAHGGPVRDPRAFVRALKQHRLMREKAILGRLAAGDERIDEIVPRLYADTDPRLHRAAALSVLAHLEDLVARGRVLSLEERPTLQGRFRPA